MGDGGDWRSQLQPDSRQKIVDKIMEKLARHVPVSVLEGLEELKRIATKFEVQIYSTATSQSDYLRKISIKMLTMEPRFQPSNSSGVSRNPQDPDAQRQTQDLLQANQSQQKLMKLQSQATQLQQQLGGLQQKTNVLQHSMQQLMQTLNSLLQQQNVPDQQLHRASTEAPPRNDGENVQKDNAETTAEMRDKKSTPSSLIEEVDKQVNENEFSLKNFIGNDGKNVQNDGNEEIADNCVTQRSPKRVKGNAKVIEKDSEGMKEVLHYVVQNDGNEEIADNCATQRSPKRVKGNAKVLEKDSEGVKEVPHNVGDCLLKSTSELMNPSHVDESSIWNLLEGMQVGDYTIARAYCFLVKDPNSFKALLACPAKKRNEVLKILMEAS